MTHLTDSEIQAAADHEAADQVLHHARTCDRCAERVRERQGLMTRIDQSLDAPASMPIQTTRRIEQALQSGSGLGATRLRAGAGDRRRSGRAFWSASAVAAATLIVVFFVAPMLKGPATVSAAEILAASASRLASPQTGGVEFLEYELTLDGVPRGLMPDHADGTYRVKQVIDHALPGRYRVATYTADGQLLSALAQDPASGRRVMTVRVGNQPYRFDFHVRENTALSVPEMERLHMEASVAMMQASGNQHLQVIDSAAGRQYRIEVPQVSGSSQGIVWDLTAAEVVIDADDYHIIEFAVKGTFLKQPYSVSYRLINREVKASAEVSAEDFDVANEAGAMTFEGEGTAIPARDALIVALRELARLKQGRE